MTSQFEAYAWALQEQEIGTKDLISQHNKKVGVHADNCCRLCKNQVEDMFHIISSCSRMSSGYYLPLRHDVISKYVYEQDCMKVVPRCKIEYPADEFIHSDGNIEGWWNLSIKTAIKTKDDKPDLIIWSSEVKTYQVVEFTFPAYINISKKVSSKPCLLHGIEDLGFTGKESNRIISVLQQVDYWNS